MNSVSLTLLLALLGAGDGDQAQKLVDPNVLRDVSVLVTSAQANFVNQGYLEQAFPEAFFYFNGEFNKPTNAFVDAGRFAFKKGAPDDVVNGKFKTLEGDYQFSLPAEDFFNQLTKMVTEIDSSFYFAPASETVKDPLPTVDIHTRADKLKAATSRFYILARKAKTPGGAVPAASVKPEYEYPPALRSILVEFGHREIIEAKVKRLKLGMSRSSSPVPTETEAASAHPVTIGRELYRDHFDYVPFRISVKYEPPGSPRDAKTLGKFVLSAHPTQSQGLVGLPVVGLENARALLEQGVVDLKSNPISVQSVLRQAGPAPRRPVIGFDIDADDFLQNVVGQHLQSVSNRDKHSCIIYEENAEAVRESACKRSRQPDGTIKDRIEIRFTPGQVHKAQTFRVWDSEKKVHAFQIEIQVEADLVQNFSTVAPVLQRL